MAVLFTGGDRHPALLAARADFPETPHQNMMPEGLPRYPCVDDRPWDDAAPGWSPYAYVERVKWWLNAASMGELTGTGQVVDPLFVPPGPDLLVPARLLSGVEAEASFSLVPSPGLADGDIRCLHLVEGTRHARADKAGSRRSCSSRRSRWPGRWRCRPLTWSALLRVAQATGLDLLRSLQNWIAGLPAGRPLSPAGERSCSTSRCTRRDPPKRGDRLGRVRAGLQSRAAGHHARGARPRARKDALLGQARHARPRAAGPACRGTHALDGGTARVRSRRGEAVLGNARRLPDTSAPRGRGRRSAPTSPWR